MKNPWPQVGPHHPSMRRPSEKGATSRSFFSGIRPGHGGVQPRPGVPPGAVGCSRRDAQALGRLIERLPGEEPHLHELGLDGVVCGELLQGLVQGQDFLCGAAGQQGVGVGGSRRRPPPRRGPGSACAAPARPGCGAWPRRLRRRNGRTRPSAQACPIRRAGGRPREPERSAARSGRASPARAAGRPAGAIRRRPAAEVVPLPASRPARWLRGWTSPRPSSRPLIASAPKYCRWHAIIMHGGYCSKGRRHRSAPRSCERPPRLARNYSKTPIPALGKRWTLDVIRPRADEAERVRRGDESLQTDSADDGPSRGIARALC